MTGVPFNDAYHYMYFSLTVPMLLIEIAPVMNLTKEKASSKCWTLGAASSSRGWALTSTSSVTGVPFNDAYHYMYQ